MTSDEADLIPLEILFSDLPEDEKEVAIVGRQFVVNTRDPGTFERLYAKAARKMMEQNEAALLAEEEKIFSESTSEMSTNLRASAPETEDALEESRKEDSVYIEKASD